MAKEQDYSITGAFKITGYIIDMLENGDYGKKIRPQGMPLENPRFQKCAVIAQTKEVLRIIIFEINMNKLQL